MKKLEKSLKKTLKKLLTRQARDDIINKMFRERQQTREVKKLQKSVDKVF